MTDIVYNYAYARSCDVEWHLLSYKQLQFVRGEPEAALKHYTRIMVCL